MFGKKKPVDPSLDWTKTGSFVHKPSRGWLHSDDSLITGGVCYAVRYVGCLQVLKSMRTLQYDLRQQVTREAILLCSIAAGYNSGKKKKIGKSLQRLLGETPQTENAGCRMNMTISSGGIKLVSLESGRILANHEMHGISFASGGEKDCIDMVGYVAKDDPNGRACHVLDCGGGLAYDVINTIGQAFEICFKMFLQNPPLATEVPERFSETIFDDTGDHTNEQEYEEPKDDGFHGVPKSPGTGNERPTNISLVGYTSLKTSTGNKTGTYESPRNFTTAHAYDVPRDSLFGYDYPRDSLFGYDVPKIQPAQSVLDDYDNPMGLQPDTFANSNGISQMNSLAFAAGGVYEKPVSGHGDIAFYENPLAVPKGSAQDDSLERNEIDLADLSFYDNPVSLELPAQMTWTTFDDELVAPPPPPMTFNPDHQEHNSPQETQRKAPPKPKPYAQSKAEKQSKTALEANSSDDIGAELWFHGPMSRAEAELLLEDEGDFLVRESTSKAGQYVLTGVQNGHPRHLLLVDPEGKIRTKDHQFSSVKELLDYHMENKLPIISSGSEVTIFHPVLRQ